MVADGMSPGVLPLGEIFSEITRGRGTTWAALQRGSDAVTGLFDEASLSADVTDSAAASSAWGSGVRIFNGAINMLPDGTKLTPISHVAKDSGRKVGLVTTTTATHATPAGFASVSAKRSDEAGIALQYLDSVDVVLAGGLKFFAAESRKDKRDLLADYGNHGYQVVRDPTGLKNAAGASKLLGLFAPGNIPYSVDRNHSAALQESVPTLTEMMLAAIGSLDNDAGFLLQVEGGRVDHGAHANDAAALLYDYLAFDDAVTAAIDFAKERGDTLVVLCSDHGNSNPGMTNDRAHLRRVAEARCSYEVFVPESRKALKALRGEARMARHMVDAVQDRLGIGIAEPHARVIVRAITGQHGNTLNQQFDSANSVLGQVLANHTGVGWNCHSHTSDYTVSTAFGPMANEFAGLVRNTHVFEILVAAMGSSFRNPSMSADRAKEFMTRVSVDEDIHWA